MFHKVLIALDGSEAAERAFHYLDKIKTEEVLLVRVFALIPVPFLQAEARYSRKERTVMMLGRKSSRETI